MDRSDWRDEDAREKTYAEMERRFGEDVMLWTPSRGRKTPGPWFLYDPDAPPAQPRAHQGVRVYGRTAKGTVTFVAEAWTKEDARLIAAAPGMLQALEHLYFDALDRGETTHPETGEEYDDWRGAREAIERAQNVAPGTYLPDD